MIRPEQVFLAVEPVDMRWGMERLSCHVRHHLGHPPSEGSAWGFVNRQRSRCTTRSSADSRQKSASLRSNRLRGRWGGGTLTNEPVDGAALILSTVLFLHGRCYGEASHDPLVSGSERVGMV